MNKNKKSIFLYYLTEFALVSLGIGLLAILLWTNQFQLSLELLSLWVFFFNAVLFSFWIWKSQVKLFEKIIASIYCLLIEIIILNSYSQLG